MEFRCPKCDKIFRPHRFIGMRHPHNAKCPKCKVRGTITETGKEERISRFSAVNQGTYV